MKQPQPTTKIPKRQIEPVFTTATVEAPTEAPAVLPIWIRLPKTGKACVFTGLHRSSMNALILGPNAPVRSVSLKKKYAVRGARLVHLASLLSHIEGMEAAQQTNPASNEAGSQR